MTYEIKLSNPWLYIVTKMTTLFLGIGILLLLETQGLFPGSVKLVIILAIVIVYSAIFILPKFTSVAEIEMTISEEGIQRKWIKQFLFYNKADDEFQWSEIDSFVFQPGRQFDQFKIYFTNGTKLRLYHNNDLDFKDGFIEFLANFQNKVEEINQQKGKTQIKRAKSFYETRLGLVLVWIFVVFVIGIIVLLFLTPKKGHLTPAIFFGLAASVSGGVYYVIQVYVHRRDRRNMIVTTGK